MRAERALCVETQSGKLRTTKSGRRCMGQKSARTTTGAAGLERGHERRKHDPSAQHGMWSQGWSPLKISTHTIPSQHPPLMTAAMAARVLACVLLGLCCRCAAAFHANVAVRVPLLRCGHAALSRSSGKLQRGCHGRRVAMQADSEGGGFFGGFFSNMFGGAVEMSPDKTRVVGAITSPSGWLCKSRASVRANQFSPARAAY